MLWFLFTLPLLVFAHLYFMHHARKQAIRFGNFHTIERITGKRLLTKNIMMLLMRCFIIVFLVSAAAGTTIWREARQNSYDVVLVIDTSASMLASDMGGTRLEAAKEAATHFVNGLDSQTKVGVVQFSGLAEVITPPVLERSKVLDAIKAVEIKTIGGTDIAGAIVTGANLLATSEKGKVIVLMTDGVASVSLYESNPIPSAIGYAQNHGVVIHTIGVGTQDGGLGDLIPGLQAQASLYDEQNLQTIANATGGSFAWARSPVQLDEAYQQVRSNGNTGIVPIKLAFGCVFAALLLLFLEWGLQNTRFRILP